MLSFLGLEDGFLGSAAAGLSDQANGSPVSQLIIQLKGIAVIGIWTAAASWTILKFVSLFTDLRVSEEEESEGVDVTEHERTRSIRFKLKLKWMLPLDLLTRS